LTVSPCAPLEYLSPPHSMAAQPACHVIVSRIS
jgi:hypothetical protein